MKKQILPAILTNDTEDLEQKLRKVRGLVEWVQVDIMDNIFVSNESIKLKDLEGIKTDLKISAHLMVQEPEAYLEDCKKYGVDRVVFHYEADCVHKKIIDKLDDLELEKGIALRPDTSLDNILPFIDRLDVILLMGVNPGYGGQEFLEATFDRIKELAILAPDTNIYIDGGVKLHNIEEISQAGATGFIVGSEIFAAQDPENVIKKLKEKIT